MPDVVKIEKKAERNFRNNNDNATRKKVAAYCRVSTGYEEQINSYESQKIFYENMIKSHDEWEFAGIYADQAITGTKADKREDFQRMINDAVAGRIDLIICKSISRFARNTVDTLQYVRKLKDKRVEVFFEEENIHTLSMDGELLLTILSSVAQQEVENISEHVKAGMQHKMANGILVGFNGCLGYDYHPEDRSLTINEEEAKVVRFIFQKYLEGYGPRMIRNELEREGIPTKKGLKEWSEVAIRGILNNEKYTGDVILGKTITVDPINKKRARNYGESDKYLIRNHHEAIISKEDFDTVQALMKKRSENWHSDEYGNRMRYSNKYPFSNVARCGFCYAPLNRRSFHGNSEKYKRIIWDCSRRIRRGKKYCVHSKAVHEEMLERAFVACFNKLVKEKNEIITDLIDSSKEAIFHKDINAELAENRKKQKDIADRNLRMIDLLMEGKINNDEYETKRQDNILKLEKLKEEEENLKNAYKRQEDSFRSIDDFKKALSGSECLESFNPEIFDLLVETVLVGGYTNGEPDPYQITFVFKGGSQRSIDGSGFKEDRRRKKALNPVWNSEGVELHIDNKEEAPALPLLRCVRSSDSG